MIKHPKVTAITDSASSGTGETMSAEIRRGVCGWIGIAEQLPESYPCLAWDSRFKNVCIIVNSQQIETWSVTHWMPVPTPPKCD